jgi:hypothetical protein
LIYGVRYKSFLQEYSKFILLDPEKHWFDNRNLV